MLTATTLAAAYKKCISTVTFDQLSNDRFQLLADQLVFLPARRSFLSSEMVLPADVQFFSQRSQIRVCREIVGPRQVWLYSLVHVQLSARELPWDVHLVVYLVPSICVLDILNEL